jgi:hypothetical protein
VLAAKSSKSSDVHPALQPHFTGCFPTTRHLKTLDGTLPASKNTNLAWMKAERSLVNEGRSVDDSDSQAIGTAEFENGKDLTRRNFSILLLASPLMFSCSLVFDASYARHIAH